MFGAILGAGASLLGGILGKPDKPKYVSAQQQSREGILGQAEGARQAADKYGFNPLTLLGVSSPLPAFQGQSAPNYLGSAIADAGMILADGMARKADAGKKSALEQQNDELRDRIKELTLRPRVGGVYAQRQATPTLRAALGQPEAPDGMRPLPETLAVDPRREVEHNPTTTSSGFMFIDNPHFPYRFPVMTLDGDEPISIGEYPTVALGAVAGAMEQRNPGWSKRRSDEVANLLQMPMLPDGAWFTFDRERGAEARRRVGDWFMSATDRYRRKAKQARRAN